jgi:eukaryotic-like serine/threonine-protein kinase
MNLRPSSPPAKNFGKYRPLAVLGRGGMATVYLAASSGPGNFTKLVVIKELKPDLSDDEFRLMFLDEARLAARLHHPNVVQTYEVIEERDQHAFVMEYLDGQPMNRVRQRLGMSKDLALGAQLRMIAEALAGLHYAHELADYDGTPLRIVHRDVSPHNIFVTYAGEVKIVDFGIAKAVDSSAQTKVGVIKGKLSYMAPEQALGEPVDRRADVFAMGLILWEAATGQRIWKGMQDAAILNLLSTGNLPQIRAFAPDANPELVRVCSRALAQNPEDRYATAAEFLADLEGVMRTLSVCPGTRELGVLVTEAFQEERKKIRGVIEEKMRAGPSETLEQLAPSMAGTPSSQVSRLGSAPMPPTSMVTAPATSASQASPLRLATIAGAVVLGVGAMVVIVAVLVLRSPAAPQPQQPTATKTTPTASAPPSAPPIASARLTINVVPKNAHATLDGVTLPTPGPSVFPADGKTHALRVEAQGYQPRTVNVTIDGDKILDISLDKAATAPPVTGAKPGTTATHGGNGDPDLGF